MSAVLVNDVLYYNKKILSSPPQTTADLLKSASQLGFYPDSYLVYEFFSAFGGQLMDANGRCIAEQGGAVDAVQFLLDLKPAGASAYTSLDQLGADFEQGKYGMIIQPAQCIMCGGHSLDTFRKQLGDQLGIAPLPAGPKGPATPLALFEYYVVNPNSKNIDGAIALGQYLTSQESIQMLVDKLQIIPVRTDVKLGDPLLAALTEASVHSVAWPATKEMNNAYVPFNNMLRDVLDGKVSPYDGVKAACYETNKLNGK
jgi:arabinogalactan oligomer/maltooligosaccharide transport system substrate-binding protein